MEENTYAHTHQYSPHIQPYMGGCLRTHPPQIRGNYEKIKFLLEEIKAFLVRVLSVHREPYNLPGSLLGPQSESHP